MYWQRAARASRGFKMVLFTDRRKTFVGGKCALPSALLVFEKIVFLCKLTVRILATDKQINRWTASTGKGASLYLERRLNKCCHAQQTSPCVPLRDATSLPPGEDNGTPQPHCLSILEVLR